MVLVSVFGEEEDGGDVVAADLEGLEGRDGLRDAAEFAVADEDDGEAEGAVQVRLWRARGARGVHPAGRLNKEPSDVV